MISSRMIFCYDMNYSPNGLLKLVIMNGSIVLIKPFYLMPKDDNNNKDENDNKISFLFPFKRYPFHFLGSFVLGAVPIIIWCWMINEISLPPTSALTRVTVTPTAQISQFRTAMFNYGMLSGTPPYTTGVGSCRAFFIRQSDINSCILGHPNND